MICISNIISAADLASINALIDTQNDQDGLLTTGQISGQVSRDIKNNRQQFDGDALKYAEGLILKACYENPIIKNAIFAKHFTPMRIIRYGKGMYYGKHIDNVINSSVRTDISFTVFLSDPQDYEGGVLRLYNNAHSQDVKLPAGSIILYPSDKIHEITPVISGERNVVVGWIQSTIRNQAIRDILSDMAFVRDGLTEDTQSDIYQKAMHSFNRLYRLNYEA
ncbi:MAG: PKHD-type hydroxylase [Alphaproteobacteria bacterium]|jgi:PKHD-type hydroxylase